MSIQLTLLEHECVDVELGLQAKRDVQRASSTKHQAHMSEAAVELGFHALEHENAIHQLVLTW